MVKFLLPLLVLALLVGCTPATNTTTEPYGTQSSSDSQAMQPSSASALSSSESAMSESSITLLSGKHTVVLKTSKGDITVELNADAAPKTVTNFITHAKNGYYDNLTFHRVIPGFMIQGGDPSGNGTGGESIFGAEFEDEIDVSSALYQTGYKAGVMAMANRGPDTNGSQFFIMDADYPLSPDYTIFGRVTKGQDVVHAIATVERDRADKPTTPVTFTPEVK